MKDKKGILVESGWNIKFIFAQLFCILLVTALLVAAVDEIFFTDIEESYETTLRVDSTAKHNR